MTLMIEVTVSWFTSIEKQIEFKWNRYCVNGNWEDELTFPYPRGDNLVTELNSEGRKVTFIPIVIGATYEVLLDLKDQIKQGLNIQQQQPGLNKTISSIPLIVVRK
jgi:hypothetical protein